MGIRALLAVTILLGVMGIGTGDAADWAIVPSVTARSEFNSNLNLTPTAPLSDFIFSVSPCAEFNYTTDISQLQGRLGLTGLHYLSHGNIDHIDQNYQINGRYQVAPRWNLSLNGAYITDSSLQEELLTSGLVMTRTPRQSIQAGPGVTYNLTERLAATAYYNFYKVNYQDPRFQNYNSQGVGLRLQQQLKNEKTVLIGNIVAQETRYPSQDNTFRSLGFQLGGNHRFSPEWEVKLLGGINLSFTEFNTQAQDLSQFPFFVSTRQAKLQQTGVEPFVNLSATRHWTKLQVTGGYVQDQAPSANGTIQNVQGIYLSGSYEFTERLSGSLGGYYSLSNQISQRISSGTDYFNLAPQLTYKVTEELTVSPGYQFSRQNQTGGGASVSANGQVAYVMLTYTQLAVASEPRPTVSEKKPTEIITSGGKPFGIGKLPPGFPGFF